MTDMLKSIARKASAERQFQFETNSAREMAKHCDRRIKKAKRALELIDTYAWSMVTTQGEPSRKELMRRITVCRETLKFL